MPLFAIENGAYNESVMLAFISDVAIIEVDNSCARGALIGLAPAAPSPPSGAAAAAERSTSAPSTSGSHSSRSQLMRL